MRSAIVFGSNGYLGRHICLYLKNNNINFTPLGKSEKSIDNYSNYLSVDITDLERLKKIDFNVDIIFMFAGLTGTKNDKSTVEKFTKVNEVGLQNIINCIVNKNKSPKVVFPSSRLVYKGEKNALLVEKSEKEKKTIYAQNKLNCEQILIESNNKHNINYTIFRVCVPYGNSFEDGYSYGTIGFFIGLAKSGENITLYGDGELKRTFTHVDDLSRIIVDSSFNKNSDNQIFNIGSNDNLSLKEVAKLIADKYSVGITYVPWPKDALEVESGDTVFSDDKIRNSLNVSYNNSIKTSFLPHNKIER
ncbi:MAG: NAD(P)-dependent oxidoreductase [Vicingaceae bacterium]|nr:NAD(P)-dependent oxidoreductase [Vicingaceae bacterium]